MAPSRTVIAHYALNGQMRSKAHTALTAPLVLHYTRIYKCDMKKIIINGQIRNKPFFIVIYYSSLVKATMNAACVCKMHNGVSKTPSMSSFSTVKGGMNIFRRYLNCSTIVNGKTRKHTNTLKGSQRMGGGRIFLKTFRASLFNEDLSNEPNLGRIHLAGQYLKKNGLLSTIFI
jgi:hypothetical protein